MSTSISSTPPGFPSNIAITQETYLNWSLEINVPSVWTCVPKTAAEIVEVCNWAIGTGWQVRPKGIAHGWSPLTIPNTTPAGNVVLVDTTEYLTEIKMIPATGKNGARVRVGAGATMLQLLTFLEQQSGGKGAASGYSFPHTPAPGNLTVGGALAINAHGTAIPSPADDFDASYGSLSNQILELTAVVTDPGSANPNQYSLRTFKRGEGDDKALLTHIGRTFVVEAVLQVIDNYNLRCQSFTDISASTLFQAPGSGGAPTNSMIDFLNKSGRVEAIWYPFSDNPWLKVWTNSPTSPSSSRKVNEPYNYPFSDNLPVEATDLIKKIIEGASFLTPVWGRLMASITSMGLDLGNSRDLWGPSKDTLLYIKDSTLRVTANGYAVQTKKEDAQQVIHLFTTKFTQMLNAYASKLKFPVNSPLEIRITALDDPAKVAVDSGVTAQSPVISSLSYDNVAIQNKWDVAVWLDVLTLPGTPSSNDFYTELEQWMLTTYTGSFARVHPEWSKGWAYTNQGAWQNPTVFENIRTSFTTGRSAGDNWDFEAQTLQKYDSHNLFRNSLIDALFQ